MAAVRSSLAAEGAHRLQNRSAPAGWTHATPGDGGATAPLFAFSAYSDSLLPRTPAMNDIEIVYTVFRGARCFKTIARKYDLVSTPKECIAVAARKRKRPQSGSGTLGQSQGEEGTHKPRGLENQGRTTPIAASRLRKQKGEGNEDDQHGIRIYYCDAG